MGIISRLSNLVKSNLNSAIDKMSDPGKEIDLLVEQMEEESRRSRVELRNQLAQEKLGQKKVDELYRGVQKWQEHAERAVHAGDDELAREALRRQKEAEGQLEEAERLLAEQSHMVARLTQQIKQNDRKLGEIKGRKETLKARARVSKQAVSVEGTAFDRFDKLAAQIEMNESQAEAMVELAQEGRHQDDKDVKTAEKFDRLLAGRGPGAPGSGDELDDRLAALKAKLDKKDPDA